MPHYKHQAPMAIGTGECSTGSLVDDDSAILLPTTKSKHASNTMPINDKLRDTGRYPKVSEHRFFKPVDKNPDCILHIEPSPGCIIHTESPIRP